MDSSFNPSSSDSLFQEGNFIEIGNSERYRYYKTRRYGMLQFVKTPTDRYSGDLITTEALKKEFLLGYGLNHPGIVKYFEFEENRLYEEYVEGETLQHLLESDDKRLHQKGFIGNVCRQILEALRYLHSNEILHLDLKPANIMVSRIGDLVKITDLSCAQSFADSSTRGFTEGYAAPEQMSGNVNTRTDIFQVGKIIEELTSATGQRRSWKRFISKSTAYHYDNRFKSTDDAIAAIPADRKYISGWNLSILFILIIAATASLILGSVSHNEENDIHQENIKTYTDQPQDKKDIIEELPRQPEPLPVEIQKQNTEKKLTKLINDKLEELYSLEVTPIYEMMLKDKNYKREAEREGTFTSAYMSALQQLQLYGEELKNSYPRHGDFIDERIKHTFESKTYKMTEKLYPPAGNPATWEKEITVTPTYIAE